MDITASGCVENHLFELQSSYSNAIYNDVMLGAVVDLEYRAGEIDSIRIKFEIKDEYIDNSGSKYAAVGKEFEGIKRLNIFRYFDEVGILLPIESHYDIENNIVYADVDDLGTYCIMDLEKWLSGLGISLDKDKVSFNNNTNTEGRVFMLGTSLSLIELAAPLSKDSETDTDEDGIPDSKEVDWDYISEEKGSIKPPILGEFTEMMLGTGDNGLKRISINDKIMGLEVLPILMDPTK